MDDTLDPEELIKRHTVARDWTDLRDIFYEASLGTLEAELIPGPPVFFRVLIRDELVEELHDLVAGDLQVLQRHDENFAIAGFSGSILIGVPRILIYNHKAL